MLVAHGDRDGRANDRRMEELDRFLDRSVFWWSVLSERKMFPRGLDLLIESRTSQTRKLKCGRDLEICDAMIHDLCSFCKEILFQNHLLMLKENLNEKNLICFLIHTPII